MVRNNPQTRTRLIRFIRAIRGCYCSSFARRISGVNKSVSKLLSTPCNTHAIRSSPIPVSIEGLGSGGQRRLAACLHRAVELHEHQSFQMLHVPLLVLRKRRIHRRVLRRLLPEVVMNLAARPARSSLAPSARSCPSPSSRRCAQQERPPPSSSPPASSSLGSLCIALKRSSRTTS